MELKVGGFKDVRIVEVVKTSSNAVLTIRIDGRAHEIMMLRIMGNEIEFLMDNKYHHAKVIQLETLETRLLIDDHPVSIKKHPKILEVLEKTLSTSERGEGGDRDIKSQIPGRVVNIVAKAGESVKKGDPIVVLESMKMQVAVKSHKEGYIKQIRVSPGVTVGRHDVVAILD